MSIENNFRLELITTVTSNPSLGGQWTATISPPIIPIGNSNIELCVSAENVAIENFTSGGINTKVAEVKLSVAPIGI